MNEFKDKKELPLSAGRYFLNSFGEILDENLVKIPEEVLDGKKVVTLEWIYGAKPYGIGEIIALVKYGTNLPVTLWKNIEAIYEDGDADNTYPDNISYRFIGDRLAVDGFPGFYYVPYFTRYAINLDGIFLDVEKKRFLNWLTTKPRPEKNIKGGYRNCRAERDDGSISNMFRHRAIGLVFLRYSKNPLRLVINHKDGIPGNDAPDNLEWCTRAQNNQHAINSGLMPNSTIAVTVRNYWSGNVEEHISLISASRSTGLSPAVIAYRMEKASAVLYDDGWLFKHKERIDWPELSQRVKAIGRRGNQIVAKNIFSGEIYVFRDGAQASELTNCRLRTIIVATRLEHVRPINGFIFRYRTLDIKWPSFSNEELRFYRAHPVRSGKAVIEKDENGRELNFFDSIESAASCLNTSASTIERECRGTMKTPITGKHFLSFYSPNSGPSAK